MASIILKWLRRCLFICVCAVFLMSHNAGAIASEAVKFYGSGQSSFSMEVNASGLTCTTACVWAMNNNSDTVVGVNYLSAVLPSGTYQSDTIFKLDFILWRVGSSVSDHTVINNIKLATPAQPFAIYDIQFQQLNANTSMFSIYVKATQNNLVLNNYSVRFMSGLSGSFIFALNPTERVSGGNWSHWAVVDTTVDTQSIVNAINNQTDYTSNLNQINNSINNINNSIDNINNDVEDATQDAADEAVDSGDQSAADAENATAGLISVIGGFVNAITTASPTNCKINGKINNSFNMGELDLCAMPVPSFVQIISSLILIAICIPFAIVMFNRFIGLFRSFQG